MKNKIFQTLAPLLKDRDFFFSGLTFCFLWKATSDFAEAGSDALLLAPAERGAANSLRKSSLRRFLEK